MKNLKTLTLFSALLIIPCLFYYTVQFYLCGNLILYMNKIVLWDFLVILILSSIIQNIFLLTKVDKINSNLENLKEQTNENHFDSIKYMQNTREMMLDGFYEVNTNGDKNEKQKYARRKF